MSDSNIFVIPQVIVIPGLFGSVIEAVDPDTNEYVQAWPSTFAAGGHASLLAMSVDDSTGTATAAYTSKVTGIVTDTSALGSDGSTGYLGDNGYSDLITALNDQFGSENVHQMPFDWRYDLDLTVNGSSQISQIDSLASRINALVEQYDKVSLVCHSMGCLATMVYLSANPYYFDNFYRIVFMAPPFYGTSEAYYRLVFGASPVSSSATTERREEWKEILTTMKGIYQICPSSLLIVGTGDSSTGDFLKIDGTWQTWKQAFDLDSNALISNDPCIKTSLLQNVGTWRTALDAATVENDSFIIGLYEIGYLGYGNNELTYEFVEFVYGNEGEVLPSEDDSVRTLNGDGNVLTSLISSMPMQETKLFGSTTHMGLVQDSAALDWICDTLVGSIDVAEP